MSYCRFGPESDLYVTGTGDGYQCLNCKLQPEEYASWSTQSLDKLFNHLMDHMTKGDLVPFDAIDRVTMEIHEGVKEEFSKIRNEVFTRLLYKLSAPNMIFQHLVQTSKIINEINDDLFAALQEMENLNWPPGDEYDD